MVKQHGGKRPNAGRKSLANEITGFTLAQPHVADAFRVLAEIMIDEKKRDTDRIASAKILIEYGCGKPKETIDNNITVNEFNIKEIFKIGNK